MPGRGAGLLRNDRGVQPELDDRFSHVALSRKRRTFDRDGNRVGARPDGIGGERDTDLQHRNDGGRCCAERGRWLQRSAGLGLNGRFGARRVEPLVGGDGRPGR